MNKTSLPWLLMGLAIVAGCAPGEPDGSGDRSDPAVEKTPDALSVFTVNYPLQYFAERIGGDLVTVSFPAPKGEDPAYWVPEPEVVADYQQADLILLNGVSYAKWLERATLPASKLVDTSAGFEARWIPLEEGPVHTHGPAGEHSHKGYAFTTWLDPQLAIEQASVVAQALIKSHPGQEAGIQVSLDALVNDLEDLDRGLESAAQRLGQEPLLFSHPVYQYLTARYGLNARAVHWEPGEAPSAEQWQELEAIVENHPSRWMIWEAQPTESTVERLQELGIQSVVFSPCANSPSSGDLLSVMQENVAALQSIGGQK